MRACRHIEVDRAGGEASLRVAEDNLRRGELVGIFPEATISRAMEIKSLKTGAARIAAVAGVPLLPMVLWGTQRMMTKDHDRDFSRGLAITIALGPPVPLTGDAVADTAALKAEMSGLLDRAIRTYPAAPARRLVGPRVVRRYRAHARGGGPPGRRGEGRPDRAGGARQVGLATHGLIDTSMSRFVDIATSCRSAG